MRRLSQHRRCQHHHYSSVSSRTCLNMQLQRYEKCVLVSFVWGQTMYIYIYIYDIHSHLDSYSRSLSLWKSLAWRKLGIFIIKSDTKTNRQTDGPTGRPSGIQTAKFECNIFAANDENVAWSPWATSFIIRLIASACVHCLPVVCVRVQSGREYRNASCGQLICNEHFAHIASTTSCHVRVVLFVTYFFGS